MYIGHYGVAAGLLALNHSVPVAPVAIGVAYPDLLWPVLVFLKKEKVQIDPRSPLQKTVKFTFYPYSHSLVGSALLTTVPAAIIALLYHRPIVGVFFFLAALSHWLLDAVMHLKDLPLLGFGKDRKIGLGLWRFPRFSFFLEYAFYAACTLLFAVPKAWGGLLLIGLVLHLFNANSFFGFTKKNPTQTAPQQAALTFAGYLVAILLFSWQWQ